MFLKIRERSFFFCNQSKQNILAWKAHLLRSINQDDAPRRDLCPTDRRLGNEVLAKEICESQTD